MKKIISLVSIFLTFPLLATEHDTDAIGLEACKQEMIQNYDFPFDPDRKYVAGRTKTSTFAFFDEDQAPVYVCIVTVDNDSGKVEYLSARPRLTQAEEKFEVMLKASEWEPHRLPQKSLMPNKTPACELGDQLAIAFWQVEENVQERIWFGNFDMEWLSPRLGHEITISKIFKNRHQAIFSINEQGNTKGIFSFSDKGLERLVSPQNFPSFVNMAAPSMMGGKAFFRGLSDFGHRYLVHGDQVIASTRREFSYLFHPHTRGEYAAIKLQKGSSLALRNPDQLAIFDGQKLRVLIQDRDGDRDSVFLDFDNSPASDGFGGLSFIGNHIDRGRVVAHLSRDGELKLAPRDTRIKELEYFSTSSNGKFVIFRAIQNTGKRGLFSWNLENSKIELLIEEGEILETPIETARVVYRSGWPGFSGAPCLSMDNQVFMHLVLADKSGEKIIGSAVAKRTLTSF